MNGFIKLDRRIMRWGWYDDNNTKALWLHILLSAYWDEREYHGETIHPGSFPTTYAKLSEQTGMTEKQLRNCLEKLKKTEEVTTKRAGNFTIISVTKWADYQGERADLGQTLGRPWADKGQTLSINEEDKKYKNIRNIYIDKLPVYDPTNNTIMNDDEAAELLELMGKA